MSCFDAALPKRDSSASESKSPASAQYMLNSVRHHVQKTVPMQPHAGGTKSEMSNLCSIQQSSITSSTGRRNYYPGSPYMTVKAVVYCSTVQVLDGTVALNSNSVLEALKFHRPSFGLASQVFLHKHPLQPTTQDDLEQKAVRAKGTG